METERVWFYLAIAWTAIGIISIAFSWLTGVEMSIYWFGSILMGQICFVHSKLFRIQPEKK